MIQFCVDSFFLPEAEFLRAWGCACPPSFSISTLLITWRLNREELGLCMLGLSLIMFCWVILITGLGVAVKWMYSVKWMHEGSVLIVLLPRLLPIYCHWNSVRIKLCVLRFATLSWYKVRMNQAGTAKSCLSRWNEFQIGITPQDILMDKQVIEQDWNIICVKGNRYKLGR